MLLMPLFVYIMNALLFYGGMEWGAGSWLLVAVYDCGIS